MIMATYRLYKALYPFEARDHTELSMLPDDQLIVYMNEDGTWPNENAWMKGTNQRTGHVGEFPGSSYAELVKEVTPQPVSQPTPPAPPPRSRRKPTWSPPPTHDLFKVTVQLPLLCDVCDDYLWGTNSSGFKCQLCSVVCHESCKKALLDTVNCDFKHTIEDNEAREYIYTVDSYREFKKADIEMWMKAVNIDVYWSCFERGGITDGESLETVDTETLISLGITDEVHQQVIMECLNELCRPTQVSVEGLVDDTDIGRWERLSGNFAGILPRSVSTASMSSANEKEIKKRGDRTVNGHYFGVHSYAAPTKCDFCSKYMLGFIRQGMKCKNCGINVHKMCLKTTIDSCDQWKSRKNQCEVFGVELAAQFNCQHERAPPAVLKCIEAIEIRGGLQLEGIYRISPSIGDINKLKSALNTDVHSVDIHDHRWNDVHVFAGALKLYLRELPEPVFTYQLYSEFVHAGRSTKDTDLLFKAIMDLVERLPSHNRNTLETIFIHLVKVVQDQQYNKMTFSNLSLVFGPTLIRPKPDQIKELVGNCDVHCKIIDVLLQKGPWNKASPPPPLDRTNKPPQRSRPFSEAPCVSPQSAGPNKAPPPPVPTDVNEPDSGLRSINDCAWYWGELTREEVTNKLRDTPDGTYLVRDSQRPGDYTLTVRKGGQNKLIRIIFKNGMYGFSEPTKFHSVPELIDFYSKVSLSQYNPRLDVKLQVPVSKFAGVTEDEEDDDNDVEEILAKLNDVTERFDLKNEEYQKVQLNSDEARKDVERANSAVLARGNIVEMLKEQLDCLKKCDVRSSKLHDGERTKIMDNVRLLGDRVTQAENLHRLALKHVRECNNQFRGLDKELNTMRPELMRLQWEKDQYTSKLIQEGLTHHEISERVKEKALNESESIYGTLYGTLEDADDIDREDECIYEPPLDPPARPPVPLVHIRPSVKPRLNNNGPLSPPPPPLSFGPPPAPNSTMSFGPAPPPRPVPIRPGGRMPVRPPKFSGSVEERPHNRQDAWYVECDRTQSLVYLKGKQDGTFLCRPAGKAQPSTKGGVHTHTIDIVYNGTKHLKVVQHDGKYGFSVPCLYSSLLELIVHYSENSLETHNPKLTTTLAYPLNS